MENTSLENLKPIVKAGHLVISKPFIPELNYRNSVILISDVNESVTSGIILNQPCDLFVKSVLKEFPINDFLFYGGPIQTNVVTFLHKDLPFPGAKKLENGFAWGADEKYVADWIEKENKPYKSIRFFAGFIVWKNEDLHSELKNNYWWKACISAEEFFSVNGDNLYNYLLNKNGLINDKSFGPLYPDLN